MILFFPVTGYKFSKKKREKKMNFSSEFYFQKKTLFISQIDIKLYVLTGYAIFSIQT